MMSTEAANRLLDEIRWYGNTIAGGGPIGGYTQAAKRAEAHWYAVTLPLLYELDAVYGPSDKIGCPKCRGEGVFASKCCERCGGSGLIDTPKLAQGETS